MIVSGLGEGVVTAMHYASTLSNLVTTFIVAHRLDTITNADIILVFENGRLIQKGNHSGLMKVEGEYKRLYSLN